MLMQEERELVVEYGRKMSTDRLSTGTSGNISVCNAEKGLMAISPSGMDYFSTTPEDVVITDLEANIVDGVRKPSSEWALHTAFYRHKPHARAVVHTHSMYCTTFAVLGQPLRAVHYAIGDTGAATVPCAPYRLFGTVELSEAAIEACGGSDAVLLGNHGLVACGRDLKSAYGLACNLEYVAELQYRTMCIGTDRDDLPTKLSVASDDCTAGVRLAKPVMEPSGVQLDSAALGNDRPQDLIKNVLIASVRVFAVLVGTISYHIVDMPVNIHFRKYSQILKNGLKIFHITFRFLTPLEEFPVIRILTMDDMRRADHEIKRNRFQKFLKRMFQMRLKPKLDPETDIQFRLILVPKHEKVFLIGRQIQFKSFIIRSRRVIRVKMLGKAYTMKSPSDRVLDHIFHRSVRICRKRRVHMTVP